MESGMGRSAGGMQSESLFGNEMELIMLTSLWHAHVSDSN